MDWFERITGFPETAYAQTKDRLSVHEGKLHSTASAKTFGVGDLEVLSLEVLRSRIVDAMANDVPLCLDKVIGDARALHSDARFTGATFQVASQFNLLEMTSTDVTPEDGITRYAYDQTQGPACAMAAGAGTIFRNYFVPVSGQFGQTADCQIDTIAKLADTLADRIGQPKDTFWEMRNGYALLNRKGMHLAEEYLGALSEFERDRLRCLLQVGVHWDVEVTDEAAAPGTSVTQVYCSALPVAYSSVRQSDCSELASLILEAAYEATLSAAFLNGRRGGTTTVLLTRLGGGAFGNANAWIDHAILRALKVFQNSGLRVLLVNQRPQDMATDALLSRYHGR